MKTHCPLVSNRTCFVLYSTRQNLACARTHSSLSFTPLEMQGQASISSLKWETLQCTRKLFIETARLQKTGSLIPGGSVQASWKIGPNALDCWQKQTVLPRLLQFHFALFVPEPNHGRNKHHASNEEYGGSLCCVIRAPRVLSMPSADSIGR